MESTPGNTEECPAFNTGLIKELDTKLREKIFEVGCNFSTLAFVSQLNPNL
jgi:hypothetical protein